MRVMATTATTQNSGVRRMRLKSMCVAGLLPPRASCSISERAVAPTGTRR